MKLTVKILCAIAFVVMFAGGCSRGGSSNSVQIKGSDTMVNLGQAWAEKFMDKNPDASIAVTGGGSGTGIAALLNGTTDIAECSRAMKQKEIDQAKSKGIEPKEIIVAYDGIAVVVHPDNPISEMTIAQLADIYTGRIKDWSEVGGEAGEIVLLSREVNSGTHVYFKEHVLNHEGGDTTVEYDEHALLMPSSQAIADEVAKNEKAIGYYGMGYISDKQKALKVAMENNQAIAPTIDNVLAGKYPISRPMFMYTNGEPEGAVKQVIDFVMSKEGQAIVEELGFVPAKK